MFGRAKATIKPSDALANLILAMREDAQLRAVITRALALGAARKQFVEDFVEQLSKRRAPQNVIQSVAILADDAICERLRQLLDEDF